MEDPKNVIYADVDGNIGWQAAGVTPRRDGWYGRLPVPGRGAYEWLGFLPVSGCLASTTRNAA